MWLPPSVKSKVSHNIAWIKRALSGCIAKSRSPYRSRQV
nr:hypothetical protein [Limosilactobacillus reuteri]